MANEARHIVISADGHAGAGIQSYKAYLESQWHEEFDGWAAAFVDPWSEMETDELAMGVASLESAFNWDSGKRQEALESQGIVAEVLFPNTAPPFFPSGPITVGAPQTRAEYERRAAGLRAHNRWLAEFCQETPGRRAGIGQIFLNDVDDAVAEVKRFKASGLSGVLLPGDAPNGLVPLYYPRYDAIWQVCADLDLPVHRHANLPGDANTPENGPAGPAVGLLELRFFLKRGMSHLIFGGVFDRFPTLKYVSTEGGADWVPSYMSELDGLFANALMKGSIAEYFAGDASSRLRLKPSEYFAKNCYLGASFLQASESALRYQIGCDRIMWGADFPHHEGTYPFTREALRAAIAAVPVAEQRQILAQNAAHVYSFDLDLLQAAAETIGPTVEEISRPLTKEEWPVSPEQTITPALTGRWSDGIL